MKNSLSIITASSQYIEAIKDLLRSERLPVDDLPPDLANFLIATDNGFAVGCVGLEIYGSYGLLRSLVVKPEYRKAKIGSELIKQLETLAKGNGLQAILLLTETAPDYFQIKGFEIITRDVVPEVVRQSSEFSHVCPASAIVMQKPIR